MQRKGEHIREGAWLPDGRRVIYNANEQSIQGSRLVERDLHSGRERGLHRQAGLIYSVAVSPDGRRLAMVSANGLRVMPAEGGEPRELVKAQDDILDVAWSGDGRHLFFTRQRAGLPGEGAAELWRVAADGSSAPSLSLSMPLVRHVRCHPDGQRVAFTGGNQGAEVWVLENFLPKS